MAEVPNLLNLVIKADHAVNAAASKHQHLIIRHLVHYIKPSKLNPPPYSSDARFESVDKLVRLHPREVRHILAALKGQLAAWFIIL